MKKYLLIPGLVIAAGIATLAYQNIPQSLAKTQTDKTIPAQALSHMRVCAKQNDVASCDAHVVTDKKGSPMVTAQPSGLKAAQLRTAYSLTGATSTATIAIVDAYNDPNVKADLDYYDTQMGLPNFPTCTSSTQTSCFQKVDQRGGTAYPSTNASWSLEIALDVESAHAVCPTCKLLLVEADSSSFSNLIAAENRASSMGASVISNSWGGSEFSSETSSSYDGQFQAITNKGKAITVSSGDNGYGVEYPAASRYVTAVGGTSLTLNSDGTRKTETAWSGAGSGCSAYESQPSFQTSLGLTGCAKRMVADVSAVADPNTGMAVFDSVRYSGKSGWFVVGGTSLASPVVAATYALSGNITTASNSIPYTNSSKLFDVLTGSNGTCSVSYLCKSRTGYDGPTGLGSPNGATGF